MSNPGAGAFPNSQRHIFQRCNVKRLLTLTLLATGLLSITADGQFRRDHHDRRDFRLLPWERRHAPVAIVPVQSPPVVASDDAKPLTAAQMRDGENRLLAKILIKRLKARAVNRAVRDGVKTPDGKIVKLSREEAQRRADAIDDSEIMEFAKVKGGPVGGPVQDFFQWLWENREAVLEFILKILSLFAFLDEPPQ